MGWLSFSLCYSLEMYGKAQTDKAILSLLDTDNYIYSIFYGRLLRFIILLIYLFYFYIPA
jgi:hypothetical protein